MDNYWLKPATYSGDEQQQRLAALLRQEPMQAQQRESKSPISQEMANKTVDWMSGFGKQGLPNSSANSMTNAVTPDFQSMNMQAPSMNMTGANQLTPQFQTANFQIPSSMQGFNPSMFQGIF